MTVTRSDLSGWGVLELVNFCLILRVQFPFSCMHYDTHTRPFNGPFSGTTRVGRYQKGKTNLDLYWSKRQWVAVASAGPYASLHLAADR